MAGSALKALHQWQYATLAADATLVAILEGTIPSDPRVYDAPNVNNPYPYLVLGDGKEAEDDTIKTTGKVVTSILTAFYRGTTFLKLEDIADRVAFLLEASRVNLTTWILTHSAHKESVPMRHPDGVTRAMVLKFESQLTQVVS